MSSGPLRVKQAKTHRGRKHLEKRAPKIEENDKKTLFLISSSSSAIVKQAATDLFTLKHNDSIKHDDNTTERPFECCDKIVARCVKYDCSLFARTSHNKKRPHCLTLGRLFNGEVLDMWELLISDFQPISSFPGLKPLDCAKTAILFHGMDFESETGGVLGHFQNFLLDFFRGSKVSSLLSTSLEHVLQFVQIDDCSMLVRSYRAELSSPVSASSAASLRLEQLVEVGPRMTWRLSRHQLAAADVWKRAVFVPALVRTRRLKEMAGNRQGKVTTDEFGTRKARLFLNRQNIDQMPVKQMRAIKRKIRAERSGDRHSGAEEAAFTEEDESSDDKPSRKKRAVDSD